MKTLILNRKHLVFVLTAVLIALGSQGSYAQTITASTPQPSTEVTLHGSVVTLTLSGGTYERWIRGGTVSVSGIDGLTFDSWDVERVSDTELTVELTFSGDFDTNATLTFTVAAGAIVGGYNGPALTAEVPVTAMQESLVASTESPLTEANLHGSIVTLTLSGRRFSDEWDIGNALTISGIDGIGVGRFDSVNRVSDTEATVELAFNDNFDSDATLTLTVGSDAIAGYNKEFTLNIPVTAMEESLEASTEFPLTEATLDGSVVTLTLSGRIYEQYSFESEEALTVSGIEGVTVEEYIGVERVSDTEVTVQLAFNGDFDTNATLTLTVAAEAIRGYNQVFTVQIPVTAVEQSNATVSVSPSPVLSPAIGEQLTLSLNITNGENVTGYQAIVLFDESALDYVKSANGDYLPADAFFGDPIIVYDWLGETFFGENIWSGKVILAATTSAGVANGNGTLATLTFKVVDTKASTVTLSQVYLVDSDGKRWETTIESGEVSEPPEPAEETVGDINRDGVVNIQDLVIVSARFGQTGQNSADVNADGIVDIVDLVLVAGVIENGAAAPSVYPQVLEMLTSADVRQWLSQAQHLHLTDATAQRGILFLEQLLAALTPKEMALLPNYPNPFNPETWIPYHLSKDADVTLHIYAVNGVLVRTLALGHQPAGMYQNRSRAAYWDGQNEFGEPVASGVYFYTLTVGDFTATRKMLIRK